MRETKEMSMPEKTPDSGFKYVFWGLLALMALTYVAPSLLMMGRGMFFGVHGDWPHRTLMFLPLFPRFVPLFVVGAAYFLLVGTLVYRDAARRGMDPWLWATIAAFVPFFIGIVIYLVMRSSAQGRCSQCGRSVRADFRVCPYCGQPQSLQCPQCHQPVAVDWKACPHCGRSLITPGP
jgi:RNA polymerase subunit RPABC4/transcription elongation factor Spt4